MHDVAIATVGLGVRTRETLFALGAPADDVIGTRQELQAPPSNLSHPPCLGCRREFERRRKPVLIHLRCADNLPCP